MPGISNFFRMPIGAGPNDLALGEIDGSPIYIAPNGTRYYEQYQPQMPAAPYESLATALDPEGRAIHTRTPNAPTPLRDMMEGLVGEAARGVTAPGRALRGEPVTYGDAWATALDYGAMSAPTSAPDGALRSGSVRSGDVPNLRGLPVDEAIDIARREPHLIPSGDAAEGMYVGGPRKIRSKRALTAQRAKMDEAVDRGAEGGDWYDRYQAGVSEVTDSPRDADWMSAMEGQYSAGVSPEMELGYALKDTNSAIAYGAPVKPARPAQQQASLRAILANDPSQFQLGPKTGEYAARINPSHPGGGATGVNDFRHARTLGYTEPGGAPQSNAIGPAGHRFSDYETALMVDRANKRQLAGRSDWTGEQIQAAPWVAQKADDLWGRSSKRYLEAAEEALIRSGSNASPEAIEQAARRLAFDEANRTIADFFPKHEAYATYEAQPFVDAGHLPGSGAASAAERQAFFDDPRSAWDFAPGGRDAIYSGMRLGDTGYSVRTRPTTAMQGVYTPPGGALETNPGAVARPMVAFDTTPSGKVVPDADRAIMDSAEATRAYLDVQGAGAWHKPLAPKGVGDVTGVRVSASERPRSLSELMDLQDLGGRYGMPDVVDTGTGVTMTNFEGNMPTFGSREGRAFTRDLHSMGGDYGLPSPAKVDGGYVGFEDAWAQPQGSGAATQSLIDRLDSGPPGVRDALDQNPYIPQAALDRLDRDADWASQWGVAREDVQNARSIIGEGPGWVSRLRKALEEGAVLPAVGAAIFSQLPQEGQQ